MAERKTFADQLNDLREKPKPAKKNESKGPPDLKNLRRELAEKQDKRFRRP